MITKIKTIGHFESGKTIPKFVPKNIRITLPNFLEVIEYNFINHDNSKDTVSCTWMPYTEIGNTFGTEKTRDGFYKIYVRKFENKHTGRLRFGVMIATRGYGNSDSFNTLEGALLWIDKIAGEKILEG